MRGGSTFLGVAPWLQCSILNLPFLPQTRQCAKLSLVVTVEQSRDPLIPFTTERSWLPMQEPNSPGSQLSTGCSKKKSALETSNTTRTSIKTIAKQSLREKHLSYWNNTLNHLQVQLKFSDIVGLEPESHTWNRLLAGLPAGQLSFMLRAGTDCLPTPLKSPLLEVRSILYMPLMPPLHTSWMDARRHLTKGALPGVMTRSSTASPPLSAKRSPLQASSLSTCQA